MAALTITALSQDFTTDVFQHVASLTDSHGLPAVLDPSGITAVISDSGNPLQSRGNVADSFMPSFFRVILVPVGFTLSPGHYTLALAINNFGQDHCQTLVKATIPA